MRPRDKRICRGGTAQMKRDEHKDLTKPRVAESSWDNKFCFSQEQSLSGAKSDFTLGHPVKTHCPDKVHRGQFWAWEKEKYSFNKLEIPWTTACLTNNISWPPLVQAAPKPARFGGFGAVPWLFEAGTKSSVLQHLQGCALRPQGTAKSTQLTLVHKEQKLKFQPADNSASHHNPSGIIGMFFGFKPTVF